MKNKLCILNPIGGAGYKCGCFQTNTLKYFTIQKKHTLWKRYVSFLSDYKIEKPEGGLEILQLNPYWSFQVPPTDHNQVLKSSMVW